MLIGTMNHPVNDVVEELAWMSNMGMEFVDLTLEPPAAAAWRVNPKAIRAALDRYRLEAVGHTAFYLPLASAFEEVRRAAVRELVKEAVETGERVNTTVHVTATVPSRLGDEPVARFELTLSLKLKVSK